MISNHHNADLFSWSQKSHIQIRGNLCIEPKKKRIMNWHLRDTEQILDTQQILVKGKVIYLKRAIDNCMGVARSVEQVHYLEGPTHCLGLNLNGLLLK